MDIKELLKDIPKMDILNLINKFEETKDIYLIRKKSGMTFKEFRLKVKDTYSNILK